MRKREAERHRQIHISKQNENIVRTSYIEYEVDA